jgi:hypothetical protein
MSFDYRNATPGALGREFRRIARLSGDHRFFTRKELRHLPSILADGEDVLCFASGMMDGSTWLIVLTSRRILFLDKGMFFGLKQVAINLEKVNAVTGHTWLLFGRIQLEDGAANRTIEMVPKRTVVPFTNAVRDAMELLRVRHSPQTPVAPKTETDRVSQLERLAALCEKGVLSEAEFVDQKARILVSH